MHTFSGGNMLLQPVVKPQKQFATTGWESNQETGINRREP